MALNRFLKRSLETSDDGDLYKCCLKSVDSELRDIELKSNGTPQYLGRTPETCIKDVCCSRKQIMLVPNLKTAIITLEVCGTNLSGLNGNALENGKKYEVRHGDVIEILHERFPYKVIFSPEPDYDKEEGEQSIKKIKYNENENNEEKSDETDSKKSDSDESVNSNVTWESIDNDDLIICTCNNVKSSEKVAAYDLDGTLIKTKSGNVHPKDITDWQIAYSNEISKKLKSLYDSGFKIVIFTNQAPIGKGRVTLDDFKVKIENIIKKLKIPVQIFIATRTNLYRKPRIGMWEYMENHKNDNKIILKDQSFYIGDAAGRLPLPLNKRKKDHSCADRLFALNVGVKFFTPEEHFLNRKEKMNYEIPKFNPKEQKLFNNDNEDDVMKTIKSNYKIPSDVCEMIIMIGLPGSGKSYFVKNFLEIYGYKIINRDKLGSIEKCIKLCEENLSKNYKCVIDNTNLDIESRKRFINIAKKYSIQCRCFLMNLSLDHIKHNLTFRELTDENHVKIKEPVFFSLKKKYVEPKLNEGFKEILKIDVVPSKFKDNFHEKLYTMYLVEK